MTYERTRTTNLAAPRRRLTGPPRGLDGGVPHARRRRVAHGGGERGRALLLAPIPARRRASMA